MMFLIAVVSLMSIVVGQLSIVPVVAAGDDVLRILIVAISVLLLFSFFAGTVAILLRFRHVLRARDERDLASVWTPRILDLVVAYGDDGSADDAKRRLDAFAGEIRSLSQRQQRILLELIVRFAFVVTGEARARLCRLAQPALPSARKLLDRRDPALRALGVHIVGLLGLDRYEANVLAALNDGSPIVGKTAARALARAGHVDYVEPILDTAVRLKYWATSEVVSILREIGPTARPLLRAGYEDPDRSTETRVICAEALRWLNDLTAAEPAAHVLRTENDRELVASSLRLLRRVGSPDHAPLIRLLCTNHDPVIRLNAIAALATTGGQVDSGDVDRMGMALADPSTWVAIRAARGLREMDVSAPLRVAIRLGHERAALARDVWPGLDRRASANNSNA